MAHNCRKPMSPQPVYGFERMYGLLENEPEGRMQIRMPSGADGSAMPKVASSGGVTDHGSHSHDTRGMKYIQFPYNNRVYECCWGNETNHQGKVEKVGQRIGHYVRNLEKWAGALGKGIGDDRLPRISDLEGDKATLDANWECGNEVSEPVPSIVKPSSRRDVSDGPYSPPENRPALERNDIRRAGSNRKTLARDKVLHNYAKWTAQRATRGISGDLIYPSLDSVDFSDVLEHGIGSIDGHGFDAWHKYTVEDLVCRNDWLCVGWSAKLINVYLKTRCYVGSDGRRGVREALHPPIDRKLVKSLMKANRTTTEMSFLSTAVSGRLSESDIRQEIAWGLESFTAIKDIETYDQYINMIASCRLFAFLNRCTLFEVEQFWDPAVSR